MASVPGRSGETRNITITTTNASAAITGAANTFQKGDVGRVITSASGINAGTTISAVASDTAATLSANATASGSRSATVAADKPTSPTVYGFQGWSPETDAEAATLTIPGGFGASDPSRITGPAVEWTGNKRNR